MWEIFVSWLQRPTQWSLQLSAGIRLGLTALISGTVVAGSIFTYQAMSMRSRIRRIKSEIPHASDDHITLVTSGESDYKEFTTTSRAKPTSNGEHEACFLAQKAADGTFNEDLLLEQLARNRVFLTDDGLRRVRSAFVIVVGCGGVGSHSTAALARSGISRIRLIDFDQVTLSSLNRHSVATLADVGTPKVQCLEKRLREITPWVLFDCRNQLFVRSTAPRQLEPWADGQPPTFVVDAIDNIDSKVDLLHYCHANSIPIISSMGAGCKSDPTKVVIGDISRSTDDPLSRSTRRRLRVRGIADGITTVFSMEKATPGKAKLLPLPDEEYEKGDVKDLGVLPDFRIRILPVLGTMPAIFGLCIANYILLHVSKYPLEYMPPKVRDKLYDGILANLQSSEERIARYFGDNGLGLRLPVTQDDVGYILEEVFHGRSLLSGLSTRLTLVRWSWTDDITPENHVDSDVPGQKLARLGLQDLVCMTKEEGLKHEKDVLIARKSPADVYSPKVINDFRLKKEAEADWEKFRQT